MSTFVKLTETNGRSIYFNAHQIACLAESDAGGTAVGLVSAVGSPINVIETLDVVQAAVSAAVREGAPLPRNVGAAQSQQDADVAVAQ